MIIINTFSTLKRYNKYPEVDILIWTTCLIRYKQFGYTTKLFCTKNDIAFLKEWHLYELYDIIDTELFENCEMMNKIDNHVFWSTRKIEAIHYQLSILKEQCIYSDIDIIMRVQFDTSKDTLFWSPEEKEPNEGKIYIPWRNMSKPAGYRMPEYILNTHDAYNGGIMYFKDPEVFEEYRKQYYAFCLNNPCKIKLHKHRGDDVEDLIGNTGVWVCNSEQRILRGVLKHLNVSVGTVMGDKGKGWSKQGVHFFCYRVAWQYLHSDEWYPCPDAKPMLNLTVFECIKTIKGWNKDLYNFWSNIHWLKGFEEKIDLKNKIYPIDEYY